MTGRARLGRGLDHAGAQALAAHLHQTEARDAAHLDARPVGLEPVLHPLLDRGVVLALVHVDEVDHDQPGQVAQAQLAGHLVGGLEIGLERGLLDRAFLGGAAGVHVDRHQRLGHADHDIAARGQLHRRVEHRGQVALHLVAREERQLVLVVLHVLGVGRHDHLHEVLGHAIAALALDEDLVDLAVIQVADRPLDQVTLLVDLGRRDGFQRQLADLLPQALEIVVVALDLGLGALGARGAHDQPRALGHLDLRGDLLELLAVGGVGDLAADPAAAGGVRHQHAVAAREAEIGGQRRALVAALFLDHLHQQDLAHLDDFLDLVAARARLARGADVVAVVVIGNGFDAVILGCRVRAPGRVLTVTAGVAGIVGLRRVAIVLGLLHRGLVDPLHRRDALLGHVEHRLGRLLGGVEGLHAADLGAVALGGLAFDRVLAVGLGRFRLRARARGFRRLGRLLLVARLRLGIGALLFHQRLAVSDGDLVVVRVDFRERQEAVAVAAVIDEGRLKRRLDPRYLGEIDVAGELPLVLRFKVELLDLVAVHHHDAGLFRVGGVDEHFLSHVILMHDPARAGPPGPGGRARRGRCLSEAIGCAAWQGAGLAPPASRL